MDGYTDIVAATISGQKEEHSMPPEDGVISLIAGYPGADQLKRTNEIIACATKALQTAAINEDGMAFRYGMKKGDLTFRIELAKFLEQQTGIKSYVENLVATAGSSQGVHFLASLFLQSGATVFVEELTYFLAVRTFRYDLKLNVVPVPYDEDGLVVAELEELINKHVPQRKAVGEMFSCMLYTIPTFHNPTGRCLAPGRCKQLVALARRHDMLVITDDVYIVMQVDSQEKPPPRLLAYDNKSDPDYKGHVISSGSFSKLLAPGLRLGWFEAGDRIIQRICDSGVLKSGGNFNQYGTALLGQVMKLGLLVPHLEYIRQELKERIAAVCDILEQKLPKGSKVTRPKGGYFIWVEFPTTIDTEDLQETIAAKRKIIFLPGVRCSPSGKYRNCLRLSFGYFQRDFLVKAVTELCDGIRDYMQRRSST